MRVSDALRTAAVAPGILTEVQTENHSKSKESLVFIAGKIRKLAAMLNTVQYPPLPADLSHLSYEEYIISQNPKAVARLEIVLDRQLKFCKTYFQWNEKEGVFWTWIQQNFDPKNFHPSDQIDQKKYFDKEAAVQLARIDKIEAMFEKVPKPKFRPDFMKARSSQVLALMGEMGSADDGPPVGVKKLAQEVENLRNETLTILDQKTAELDKSIIKVLP